MGKIRTLSFFDMQQMSPASIGPKILQLYGMVGSSLHTFQCILHEDMLYGTIDNT